MRKLTIGFLVAMGISASDLGAEPFGIWLTETGRTGAYLHVEVAPCKGNRTLLCGYIHETFKTPHTEIVGRPIFWDLEQVSANQWVNGRVWDAENRKVYWAKVTLHKTELRVEGCLGILCDGQSWKRVR
ncbi:DUF2147 domain-containing protein [Sulfitobacter dubius]|uniref:DUF2147 domain-containing protein n=1 Tax=Sulfitobacter dubius TaxID=218673 RepID=A0ABY3ZQM8_9RHOB|nr:DUF2147 domain-containing protein [Sulfitobacter dubius]UOA16552.1 hypothetical protein DSM109990_03436 [Sulfitobacter dubius]